MGRNDIKLRYGNTALFLINSTRVEFAHYTVLRYFLKRLVKPKNIKYNIKNCWVFLGANYPISKKSTNSRMGKGAGSFKR